jgi:hypothetical protein
MHQIQQAANPMGATVISEEAARVNNAILLDYMPSEVALDEPEIWSTDHNIPKNNHCTDDDHHFGMPRGSGDEMDEGEENDVCDDIRTLSRWRQHVTGLQRFDLETSVVTSYEGEDDEDADADEEEEASQANGGSAQNVQHWGYSRFDLETSDVDGCESKAGDDADADEEVEASQADDGSTLNVEDCEHITRECEELNCISLTSQ